MPLQTGRILQGTPAPAHQKREHVQMRAITITQDLARTKYDGTYQVVVNPTAVPFREGSHVPSPAQVHIAFYVRPTHDSQSCQDAEKSAIQHSHALVPAFDGPMFSIAQVGPDQAGSHVHDPATEQIPFRLQSTSVAHGTAHNATLATANTINACSGMPPILQGGKGTKRPRISHGQHCVP